MKRKKSRFLSQAFLVAATIYTSLAIFLILYELLQISESYVIILLAVVTCSAAVYAIWRAFLVQKEVKRVTVGESYPIVCEEVVKKVTVLNEYGDAEIDLLYVCRNTSKSVLQQFVLSYYFDGDLENIDVKMNDSRAKAQTEELVTTWKKGETGRFPLSLPNLLRVKFDPRDMNIAPGGEFTCKITVRLKRCYEKLFDGEFSSFHIYMPTRSLVFVVRAPKNLKVVKETLDFSVRNRYEILDDSERQRIASEYTPEIDERGEEITWKLATPKLAANYILCFSLRREP